LERRKQARKEGWEEGRRWVRKLKEIYKEEN
jgi:hypothetical protein